MKLLEFEFPNDCAVSVMPQKMGVFSWGGLSFCFLKKPKMVLMFFNER